MCRETADEVSPQGERRKLVEKKYTKGKLSFSFQPFSYRIDILFGGIAEKSLPDCYVGEFREREPPNVVAPAPTNGNRAAFKVGFLNLR